MACLLCVSACARNCTNDLPYAKPVSLMPLIDCQPPPVLSHAPTQEAIAGDLINLAEAYQSCRAAFLNLRGLDALSSHFQPNEEKNVITP